MLKKFLPYISCKLMKGLLLTAFVCMQNITPANAEICFLPSGECKSRIVIQSESCKTWSATEREQVCSTKNGYVRSSEVTAKENNGFICTSALSLGDTCCPGWYYCTERNCQDQGFKLKTQLNPDYYICTPCTQGGDTYYKCVPKPCNYDPDNPKASTLSDVCTNTNGKYCIDTPETNLCVARKTGGVTTAYVWTASSSRKSGERACGRCEASAEPPAPVPCKGKDNCATCKGNKYYWEENLPGGCVTCTVAGNVSGKDYYCCQDIEEYPIAGCTDDEDGACFTCEGPVLATGADKIKCYKKVPKKCGNDNQYVDKSISGCYCRDYDYYLNANPTSLNFTAAGGSKTVGVESTISTRTSTSKYEYTSETGKTGLCVVSDNSNGTVTVNCGINVSTTPSTSNFNITQTPKKITTTHPVLHETVRIKVEGDTCYQYQFSNSCTQSGWVAEYRRMSESGAKQCYECVNDNCPAGYTKGTTPNPSEGYDTTRTDHGSNCYKAKSCEGGATTTNLNTNGECYDCTEHGYAGQAQCWLCSHMDTTCDTSNGYTWSESSCGCIEAGCTSGDVSKQSVADCGSSGSAGWDYTYSGMSGGKKCGICTKKECSGSTTNLGASNPYYNCTSCYDGDVEKFTCTCNLTDAMCGAGKKADTSTCECKTCSDSCEKHSLTSNCTAGCSGNKLVSCTSKMEICGITCYEKSEETCTYGCANGQCKEEEKCPTGYSTAYQSAGDCNACETFSSNGTANGKVCGKCTAPDTSCGSGQSWDNSQCKCVDSSCPTGYSTQYQSVSDCPACNSFSSNGSSGGKVCGKCTAPNTSCGSGQSWDSSQCKCVDSSCPTGYSTSYQSASDCNACDTFSSDGYSGSKVCGKCTAPDTSCSSGKEWSTSQCKCIDSSCPTGYSTSYQSASDCPACYNFDSNGTSGSKVCGKCTAPSTTCGTGQEYSTSQCKCVDKSCPTGYSTSYQSASDCNTCDTFSSDGYSGSKVCGKCTAPNTTCGTGKEWSASQCKCVDKSCPTGYSTQYQSSSDCNTCDTFSSDGYSGSKVCGKCTAPNTSCGTGKEWSTSLCQCVDKSCPTGYDTAHASSGSCSACYTHSTNGYSGDKACGKCTAPDTDCASDEEYSWADCECLCTPKSCPTTTYPYTSSSLKTSGGNYEECDPGCGNAKRYKCNDGYKLKNQNCVSDECPVSGEKKSTSELSCTNGTEAGTSTPYGTACYKCKDCVQTTCSTTDYPYTARQISPTNGSNYEECDPGCGGTKRYRCKDGYKVSDRTCKSDECPVSGEKKNASELSCTYGTEEGTATEYGSKCYKCKGCSDSCSNHSGWLSSCTSGCSGNTKVTCTEQTDNCGGTCYTKSEETCTNGCENGSCKQDSSSSCPSGLYNSESACKSANPGYNCAEASTAAGCWTKTSPITTTSGSLYCYYDGNDVSKPVSERYKCSSSVSGNISTIEIDGSEYGNINWDTNYSFIGGLSGKTCTFLNGTQSVGTDTFAGSQSGGWSCSYP